MFKYDNDFVVTSFSVGWYMNRAVEAHRKRSLVLPKNENKSRTELLLVEFKAPKELVEAFDTKLRSKFSNRSEAIRSLMRTFVEAANERS